MLYKFVAVACLLALTLAQDDEVDVVDVEMESTDSPFGSTDSLVLDSTSSLESTDSGDDSFESSMSSLENTDSSVESAESDDDDSDDDDDGDDDVSDESFGDGDDDVSSGDDTDDDNDGTETSDDGTASFDDDDDECADLPQAECAEAESADGDQDCGFNSVTGECYSIERRNGEFGSGNYDDGYKAAKKNAAQESSQLYTVVGVLSGVIGALVLVIAGGLYYFYNKNKAYDMSYDVEREMNQISRQGNDEDGEELIKTVEDVSPVVTRA